MKLLNVFKKPVVLITHSGSFHSDDVMACAILQYYFESKGNRTKVIRTRDEKIIATGDVVFDVGLVHDESHNRFDHHQTGGAGQRENGIPYSSVGLVWNKFGPEICAPFPSLIEKIDRELIQSIDANDTGCDTCERNTEPYQLPLSAIFMVQNASWKEQETLSDSEVDERFMIAMNLAKDFFTRYLQTSKDNIEASEKIKKVYDDAIDKRVLVFEQNFTRIVFIANLVNFPEPLIHIYPDRSGTWSIETVPISFGSFEKKIDFPESWAGLRADELQKISGIPELLFCHYGRFLCKTTTREAALKVAEYTINQG
jgi:uncharacterized UPF0160 family protein